MNSYLEELKIPCHSYSRPIKYDVSFTKKSTEYPEWVNKLKRISEKKLTVYYIDNLNFKRGTYRITNPGIYMLSENITFNPNPDNDFRPYPYQHKFYNELTYRLGFFAAITVESDNVIIDLNGFTIKQSKDHYINQRFYANIELGNSPFTPNNGPANFGTQFENCNNVVIKNGTLGLSSHHGIHGNNSENIVFKNLFIQDYEVGGISLNGCANIVTEDIVLNTIPEVAFNHRFVHLKICKPFIDELLKTNPTATLDNKSIQEIVSDMNKTLLNIGGITENKSRLVDGNAYGLSFNGDGPVVGAFKTQPQTYTAKNIFINNITINSIKTNVIEVPGYKRQYISLVKQSKGYESNIQKGPIGQVLDLHTINTQSLYSGNILSDVQLILAKYSVISTIDKCLIDWADINKKISFNNGYIYGIDNMNHVLKGNIGIFFSNVKDGTIQNVHVKEMINASENTYGKHDGHNNNALAIIGSKDICLKNIVSSNMVSKNGKNSLLLIK